MIRSSIPSKRGQRMTSPGPAAHSRARVWRERPAARAHDEARARIVRPNRRVEVRGEHVGAHHHARPAAGGRVVDRAMAPEPMFANVVRLYGP